MRLLVATKNRGKFLEVKEYLERFFEDIYFLKDFEKLSKIEVIEDGKTFCENSLKKAITYSELIDFLVLGDDSGLEVDFLDGFPGVNSSRWAGEGKSDREKYMLLLEKLRGVPVEKRGARFVSCMTLAKSGKELFSVKGICSGYILEKPVGEGGFGYDPIFYVPELKKTFAQLTPEEKNKISHRGRALKEVAEKLKGMRI